MFTPPNIIERQPKPYVDVSPRLEFTVEALFESNSLPVCSTRSHMELEAAAAHYLLAHMGSRP